MSRNKRTILGALYLLVCDLLVLAFILITDDPQPVGTWLIVNIILFPIALFMRGLQLLAR